MSRAFQLLQMTSSFAVFQTAERAGDVVDDSRHFQCGLSFFIQLLQQADGTGVGVDFHKMIDVMKSALVEGDHFLGSFGDVHGITLLFLNTTIIARTEQKKKPPEGGFCV